MSEFTDAAKRVAQWCDEYNLVDQLSIGILDGYIQAALLLEKDIRTVLDYETPRVEIELDDNNDGGIYIHDSHGEIVCWITNEFLEDISVAYSALNALNMAHEEGATALRETIGMEIE